MLALVGLIGVLACVAAIVFPQFWVKRVLARHGEARADYPGTGGELAKHLVERFGLTGVTVEQTDEGDHYDPESKTVRLSKNHFSVSSLSAVAVAAHEVGHALQHANEERGLRLRNSLVSVAQITDGFARVFFIVAPILGIALRTPRALFVMVGIGLCLLAVRVLVHLVTLPVELDASFGKALPILEEGEYLSEEDMDGARQVLRAAALTYVSAALMSLVDIARWIRVVR